jgi:signal transduction histidine kinase
VFSLFAMACAIGTAILQHQAGHSIYVPGLATILLLANVAKRSQVIAQDAKLQTELARQERDRAEEGSRFKSMFLSLVSHELLTPLQSIRLSSDALTRARGTGAPERLDHVERIARGGRRLTDLIESLLHHAQIENGKLSVLAEPFDLVALATDAIDELSSQGHAKQLDVRIESEASDCIVTSDPRLVRLVLVNLVGNAIKYTEKGWVVVAVRSDASACRVSVRDTGRGIPPEQHERIFEAFTQVEPLEHKHVPGLGLGLALVKEMTAALAGRLELASALGSGSTFTLVLPRHPQTIRRPS